MNEQTANRLAEAFVEARRSGARIPASQPAAEVSGIDEAYLVQARATSMWPDQVAGWKIGCANSEQQKALHTDEPFYAPVFAKDVLRSPARVDPAALHMLGIESELMFRLAHDLEPEVMSSPPTEISEWVESMLPGIEIFSSRLESPLARGVAPIVADFGGNGALIVGPPEPGWRSLDLARIAASLSVNGQVVAQGRGDAVLGNPLRSLRWFLHKCLQRGQALKAGQIVACGSLTPLHMCAAGDRVVADFAALGTVTVELCA